VDPAPRRRETARSKSKTRLGGEPARDTVDV